MKPSFDHVIHSGLRTHGVALRYPVGDRLQPGTLDRLLDDIETLKGLVPETVEVRRVAMASTAMERAALARGYEIVRGVRSLARAADVSSEVRKHYGVGAECNPKLHNDVVSVLEQILNRASAEPNEAARVGIADEDLANVRAALVEIRNADRVQRELKIKSPATRQTREEVAQRILGTVRRIASAGLARYANQPAVAEFQALLPRRRRGGTTQTPPSSMPVAS